LSPRHSSACRNRNRIGLPIGPVPENVLGAAGISLRYTIRATDAADGVVAGAALRTAARFGWHYHRAAVGADRLTGGVVVTAAVSAVTALACVLIRPAVRALDAVQWWGSVGLPVGAAGLVRRDDDDGGVALMWVAALNQVRRAGRELTGRRRFFEAGLGG
jgi:hypothetical protein